MQDSSSWWSTAQSVASKGWVQLQSAAATAADIAAEKLNEVKEQVAQAAVALDEQLARQMGPNGSTIEQLEEGGRSSYERGTSDAHAMNGDGTAIENDAVRQRNEQKKQRAEKIATTPAPWDFVGSICSDKASNPNEVISPSGDDLNSNVDGSNRPTFGGHPISLLDPSEDPEVIETIIQSTSNRLERSIRALTGSGQSIAESFMSYNLIPIASESKADQQQSNVCELQAQPSPNWFNMSYVEFHGAKALRLDRNLASLYYLCVNAGDLSIRHVRPANYESLLEMIQSKRFEEIDTKLAIMDEDSRVSLITSYSSSSSTEPKGRFVYRTMKEDAFWYHYFMHVNEIRKQMDVPPLISEYNDYQEKEEQKQAQQQQVSESNDLPGRDSKTVDSPIDIFSDHSKGEVHTIKIASLQQSESPSNPVIDMNDKQTIVGDTERDLLSILQPESTTHSSQKPTQDVFAFNLTTSATKRDAQQPQDVIKDTQELEAGSKSEFEMNLDSIISMPYSTSSSSSVKQKEDPVAKSLLVDSDIDAILNSAMPSQLTDGSTELVKKSETQPILQHCATSNISTSNCSTNKNAALADSTDDLLSELDALLQDSFDINGKSGAIKNSAPPATTSINSNSSRVVATATTATTTITTRTATAVPASSITSKSALLDDIDLDLDDLMRSVLDA